MSKIITPTTTIIIEIDNMVNPPRLQVRTTGGGLSHIGLIGIFSILITQFAQAIAAGAPGQFPHTTPPAEPGTEGNRGN